MRIVGTAGIPIERRQMYSDRGWLYLLCKRSKRRVAGWCGDGTHLYIFFCALIHLHWECHVVAKLLANMGIMMPWLPHVECTSLLLPSSLPTIIPYL